MANEMGKRYRCAKCGTELIVTRAGTVHRSKKGVLSKMPNLLGRRFRCEVCNTEVLITKAGEGAVECCGKPMTAQQPRPLPSSD
jgi:transcription elongation factor Elf1